MRKYYGIVKTISGTTYRVEIWDAPSGSATGGTQLSLVGEGFRLTYNEQGGKLWENAIQSSKIQAQFAVSATTDHAFFKNLAVEYEGNFAMVIYKNNVLFYVGKIIADGMQYERRPEPNTVYTVTAVDGLSMLKNFKVKKSWFGSIKRMSIMDLIRLSLAETFIPDYYTALSRQDDYFLDVAMDYPSAEFVAMSKNLNFNLSSVISNLNEFINFHDDEDIYIDCKTAIERLLLVIACKLTYSNGYFTIYNPVIVGSTQFIFAFVYSTSGVYKSRPTINTQYVVDDGERPCFEAFPAITHQPPQLKIEQTYTRMGFDYLIRPFQSRSTSSIMLEYKSIGVYAPEPQRVLNVSATIGWISTSFFGAPPKQQFAEINFRIYIQIDSTTFLHYDYQTKSWSSPQSSIPFFEKIRLEVTSYERINTSNYAKNTVDFKRAFLNSPSPGQIVIVEISMGQLTWNFTTGRLQNAFEIWGTVTAMETDAAPKKLVTTNTKNTKAVEIEEMEVVYGYEFNGWSEDAVGTIFNAAQGVASNLTGVYWAEQYMSVYVDAPKVAQASLIDNGGYHALLCPNFDDESYIFNGGVFSAQSEQWNFELLRIAQDVINIDSGELDFIDEVDINKQQNNAVGRIIQQQETNREAVGNVPLSLPYDILGLSINTPTSDPTINTNFVPVIAYDVTGGIAVWNVQELGRVQSLNGGTHSLDPKAELIVCNSTAEDVIINLPAANTTKGIKFYIKKTVSSNKVRLQGSTIDGITAYEFNGKDDCKVIMSDGTGYYLVAYYHK